MSDNKTDERETITTPKGYIFNVLWTNGHGVKGLEHNITPFFHDRLHYKDGSFYAVNSNWKGGSQRVFIEDIDAFITSKDVRFNL